MWGKDQASLSTHTLTTLLLYYFTTHSFTTIPAFSDSFSHRLTHSQSHAHAHAHAHARTHTHTAYCMQHFSVRSIQCAFSLPYSPCELYVRAVCVYSTPSMDNLRDPPTPQSVTPPHSQTPPPPPFICDHEDLLTLATRNTLGSPRTLRAPIEWARASLHPLGEKKSVAA